MARSTKKLLTAGVLVSGRRGSAFLTGDFTLGGSGAIASTTGFFSSAAAGIFGLVKTAAKTGRYTFTCDRNYRRLRVVSVDIVGPTDAGITTATANTAFARNVSGKGFDLQLAIGLNAGGTADTDGMSGLIVSYIVEVETFGGKS